jgi:hypothetical protein
MQGSEVLSALVLHYCYQFRVVIVNSSQVVPDAVNSFMGVVSSSVDAVRVAVLGTLAQVDQVAVEDTHVGVFAALDAHLYLMGVGVSVVHPFGLKAVSSCVFHALNAHVFERRG